MNKKKKMRCCQFQSNSLFVGQMVRGVEISDLRCSASGNNSNLASEDIADIRRQGISVDNDNGPFPKNIPVPKIIPSP